MESVESILGLPPDPEHICADIALAREQCKMAINLIDDSNRHLMAFRESFAALRRWGAAWKEKAEFLLNLHYPGWQRNGEPDYFSPKKAEPAPTPPDPVKPKPADVTPPPAVNGNPEDKIE